MPLQTPLLFIREQLNVAYHIQIYLLCVELHYRKKCLYTLFFKEREQLRKTEG